MKIENETEFSCFFGLDPPNISIFIFAQKNDPRNGQGSSWNFDLVVLTIIVQQSVCTFSFHAKTL